MTSIEKNLLKNTELTQQIARNTAGFVAFQSDLESGTRFLCRCVKGLKLCLEIINEYWKPGLIIFATIYWLNHDHTFPKWLVELSRGLLE